MSYTDTISGIIILKNVYIYILNFCNLLLFMCVLKFRVQYNNECGLVAGADCRYRVNRGNNTKRPKSSGVYKSL